MRPFTRLAAIAVPLLRDNVDTDAIIPSREITAVSKAGLAPGLFADWRYLARGSRELNPQFVLNDPRYRGARILLSGTNFGCGSSREHAVWALAEYGFQVLIAGSFNPIFFRNCARNGLLAVTLPQADIDTLAADLAGHPDDPGAPMVTVDLASQSIDLPPRRLAPGLRLHFSLPADIKRSLLQGLDPIDQTLEMRAVIGEFREKDRLRRPWVYAVERGSNDAF